MTGIKQKVIKLIRSLPEDVTVTDIMAELYFMIRVDGSLKDSIKERGFHLRKPESKCLTGL
jgi:hypothetical protein